VNNPEVDMQALLEVPVADSDPTGAVPEDDLTAEPAGRFRRRLERFKGLADTLDLPGSMDDEAELKLQLILLREENARLKAARHQPSSTGTVIDRVRMLPTPATEAEQADDAWSLLADCLVIREGLDQACVEITRAIESVRDRLETIADRIDSSMPAAARANGAEQR
jgi:hypothetical protein